MPRGRIKFGDEIADVLMDERRDNAVLKEAYEMAINSLDCRMGQLADLIREYLKNTRVRANAGFKPGRCVACDVPHPAKLRACHCPHHQLIELLNELGYPAAEVTLYG